MKDAKKNTFVVSFLLYALILLPILITDRYNVDDWGRTVIGYLNWGQNGRPLADVVMTTLGLGRPLVDFPRFARSGHIPYRGFQQL